MKLKFSIHYATQWGENLQVVLRLGGSDGTVHRQRLTMLTDDGQQWSVETSAVVSRQHRLERLAYHYEVANGQGETLRSEWAPHERGLHFDASRSYTFADQWHDRPLCSHLYSRACEVTRGTPPHAATPVEALTDGGHVPLYRRTLVFRVSAPQLEPGQSLAVLGAHPALGAWSSQRYLLMEPWAGYEWVLSVNVAAIDLPLEYKYVVVDDATRELAAWEEGDNRSTGALTVADGQVHVMDGDLLRLKERTWRAAGVSVPVFALRSASSFGVGDFGDLKRLVDWAVVTGMKVIQLLPVNDTTTDGHWNDSHPYNIVSGFALHPHYLDLSALPPLKDKVAANDFRRRQRELNALDYSDYEAVGRVKDDYVAQVFAAHGEATLRSDDYRQWHDQNSYWLDDYAQWRAGSQPVALTCYTQYMLHLQLKAASDYARSRGVILKGDLPVGVSRQSVEAAMHPGLFNLDSQTGTPPDALAPLGQNWGFPTYNWGDDTEAWLRCRTAWMEQYFDALRIDHVLAFFRVWEIPADAVHATLGHFSPSLPLTADEIAYFGLPFRRELLTRPFVNDRVLDRLFGIHADYVRSTFLTRRSYGLYDLKPEYDTQRKVHEYFDGMTDENSLWIRDGLCRLLANVLFLEDPHRREMYHPRIGAWHDTVFDALNSEEKDAYMRLYNNYFYQRHDFFWGGEAIRRLTAVFSTTRMLLCAEDLGMLPDCVAPVLDHLRILSLEVQSMPKQQDQEFAHLEAYPYRSVATISTHDMAPLRLWWQESPERTQRYYVTMLQKQGRAPEQLPPHLAEEIVARHLYCPSMLCILSMQDWLAMDATLRSKSPRKERVNFPGDPFNHWQWRMPVSLEQLMEASQYNTKLKTMITRSKR